MPTQMYGLTGRKIRPDYVGAINASTPYLAEKKRLKDEEDYRNKMLALTEKEITQNADLARERLNEEKGANTASMAIGLGQLGASTYFGAKKDKALEAILSGGGGKAENAVPAAGFSAPDMGRLDFDYTPDTSALDNITSGLKGAVTENWPSIGLSSLVGATAGSALGEKVIGGKAGKAIGGAVTSGIMSYLATSDPYSAGLSALFGAIGGLF